MPNPIFIDLAELSGVDAETYRAADRGDRQAQKLMLRRLLTSNASAEALTTKHWTHWMLRMVATGAEQATSDALGSIAEAARTGKISKAQNAALDELFEQYFGPGEVGEATARRALAAFAGKPRETKVLQLFLLADRLASGVSKVVPREVWEAALEAGKLDAPGAASFFRAVWAQLTCAEEPLKAFDAALDAIKPLVPLADSDAPYRAKLGQLALLASQIAEIAGDRNASLLLRTVYADQIAAFRASERQA
jgi:hypothetical protein